MNLSWLHGKITVELAERSTPSGRGELDRTGAAREATPGRPRPRISRRNDFCNIPVDKRPAAGYNPQLENR